MSILYRNALDVLQLNPNIQPDELQREMVNQSYRHLVKLMHPDRGGNTDDFIELQQAYKVLIHHIDVHQEEKEKEEEDQKKNVEIQKEGNSYCAPAPAPYFLHVDHHLTLQECYQGGLHSIKVHFTSEVSTFLSVQIPPYHHDNNVLEIHYFNESLQQSFMIHVTIHIVPHMELTLDHISYDLIYSMKISWLESILGFRKHIPVIHRMIGSKPGQVTRSGKYMVPHYGWQYTNSQTQQINYGHLVLLIEVELPNHVPACTQEWLPWIQQQLPNMDNTDLQPHQWVQIYHE
jgi:DnaJ-class molecular chaperone